MGFVTECETSSLQTDVRLSGVSGNEGLMACYSLLHSFCSYLKLHRPMLHPVKGNKAKDVPLGPVFEIARF